MKREHIHRTIAAFLCAVMVMAECPLLVQTTQAAEKNGLSESAIADMEMAPDKELEATLESEMAEYAQQATDIGVGISELSVSYSGGTWQYNNNVLQGYIRSGESVEQEAKLFFLNSSGQAASLEFTYGGYVKSGKPQGSESSITVPQREPIVAAATTSDATQVNLPPAGDDGKVRIDLQAGESACISMKAGTGNSLGGSMVYITISNITFTVKQDTSVTFGAAQNGSYTVKNANGETLNIGTAYPVESTMKFTVAATPDEGYKFLRWEVADGAQLSPEQSGELMAPTGGTVQPVFVTNDTPIFRVGTQAFDDLAEAIGCAQGENSAKTIVMTSDGALKEGVTYTIPAGVTLLVPYADEPMTKAVYPYMEEKPEESSGQNPWTINAESYEKAPYANRGRTDPGPQNGANVLSPVMDPLADGKVHRTLTIPATTTVRIEKGGVFSVGGVMSGGGHGTVAAAGGIIGQHSNIQLDGSIVVAGVFSCNGFVLGSGSITTESGGAIYEPFVVMDFHAGSWTLSASKQGIPIFLRYTMPNIQTKMTVVSGARLYGYCDLIAGSQHNTATGQIIGGSKDTAVIRLAEAAVLTAEYATINWGDTVRDTLEWVGKTTLVITGGASYGSLDIQVTNTDVVSTKVFPFVLPYNFDITLKSGSYDIDGSFYILPGASLTVDSDATLNTGEKATARFAVFTGLSDHTRHDKKGTTVISDNEIPFPYPSTAELRGADSLNCTGGLFLKNGGKLNIGSKAVFGGFVQGDGNSQNTISSHKLAVMSCVAKIGAVEADSGYAGQTTYTLRAQVVNDKGSPQELWGGSTFKGSGTSQNYTVTQYEYTLAETTTKTVSKSVSNANISIAGCFTTEGTAPEPYEVYENSNPEQPLYYGNDFNQAWKAAQTAKSATIVLHASANITTIDGNDGEIIGKGQDICLNLNGYSITGSLMKKSGLFRVNDGGQFAVTDPTGAGTITATADGNSKIASNAGQLIKVDVGGILSITGGNLSVTYGSVEKMHAHCINNEGTIKVISGGITLSTARSYGNALKNSGTIERISGIRMNSEQSHVLDNSGTITEMENCTVTAKASKCHAVYTHKGSTDGSPLSIGLIRNCAFVASGTPGCALYNEYTTIGELGENNVFTAEKSGTGTSNAVVSCAVFNRGVIEKVSGGEYIAEGTQNAYAVYCWGTGTYESKICAITGGTYTAIGGNSVNVSSGKATIYEGRFKGKSKAGITGNVEYPIGKLSDNSDNDGYYWVETSSGYTITVSGSGVADVSLDGMGSGYTATDKVTVAAPEVKGYTFTGWYRSGSEKPWRTDLVVKTTVAQMLADGLFDENGTANLVAEYAEDETTAPLTLTLKGAPDDVTVGGGTKNSDGTWSIPVGTEVTIDASKVSGFQYWTNANDKVMSRGLEYTFTMVTNTTLEAETSTSNTFVIFQSADGRLLKADTLNKITALPDAPYRVGYKFAEWKVGNETVSTAQDITADMATNGVITVTAAYGEITAGGLSVTVYVDGQADGSKTQNNLSLGAIATFTADQTVNDKAFRFWASDVKGTNILSFSQKYSFRVTESTTIYAIYGGTSDKPNVQPVVRVDNVLKNPDGQTKSLTFMIGASIPENYTLVEMGALYAKGSGDDTTLRVENVGTGGVLKAVSKLTQQKGLTDYSYALGFKMTDKLDTTIYLRGYVAVKDSTETIYYYYSSVRFASYNNPNGTSS